MSQRNIADIRGRKLAKAGRNTPRGLRRGRVLSRPRAYVSVGEREMLAIDASAISQEKEYYAEIYGRYLRDEAQSEAAKATRAGKAIP